MDISSLTSSILLFLASLFSLSYFIHNIINFINNDPHSKIINLYRKRLNYFGIFISVMNIIRASSFIISFADFGLNTSYMLIISSWTLFIIFATMEITQGVYAIQGTPIPAWQTSYSIFITILMFLLVMMQTFVKQQIYDRVMMFIFIVGLLFVTIIFMKLHFILHNFKRTIVETPSISIQKIDKMQRSSIIHHIVFSLFLIYEFSLYLGCNLNSQSFCFPFSSNHIISWYNTFCDFPLYLSLTLISSVIDLKNRTVIQPGVEHGKIGVHPRCSKCNKVSNSKLSASKLQNIDTPRYNAMEDHHFSHRMTCSENKHTPSSVKEEPSESSHKKDLRLPIAEHKRSTSDNTVRSEKLTIHHMKQTTTRSEPGSPTHRRMITISVTQPLFINANASSSSNNLNGPPMNSMIATTLDINDQPNYSDGL